MSTTVTKLGIIFIVAFLIALAVYAVHSTVVGFVGVTTIEVLITDTVATFAGLIGLAATAKAVA